MMVFYVLTLVRLMQLPAWQQRLAPVALAAPALCALVDVNQRALFGRYEIGLELLLLNGAITFAGLWVMSSTDSRAKP